MSTESVSPASFYERREFGISLFYPKASFQLRNSILLFDAFPEFRISDSEVEHHPMVIEIDDSNYPEGTFSKVKSNDGFDVYRATRTLYISPLSCKIYFDSERDKRVALSKAENIIEAKYFLYERFGAIAVSTRSRFDSRPLNRMSLEGIQDCQDVDYSAIDFDKQVDKAKGFVVSYLIGASKRLSADSARMLRLVRDIKNSIYSLSSKESTLGSNAALNALWSMVAEAESLSKVIDQRKIDATKRIYDALAKINASEKLNGSTPDAILNVFKAAGVYSAFYEKVNSSLHVFNIESCVGAAMNADDEKQGELITMLEKYVGSIISYETKKLAPADVFASNHGLRFIECNDSSLPPQSRQELNILFNLFAGYNASSSSLRMNRVNYVFEAGTALGIANADQSRKDYFNALLDNLQHAAKFDLMGTDDPVFQGLAGFMRSPDKDMDKMVNQLVHSEVVDPRVAYGLWGVFYGYSNVQQNYFNSFVRGLDDKAAKDFIEQVYLLMHASIPVFPEVKEVKRYNEERSIVKKGLEMFGGLFGSFGSKDIDTETEHGALNSLDRDTRTFPNELQPGETYELPFDHSEIEPESTRDSLSTYAMPSSYAELYPRLRKTIEEHAPARNQKEEFIRYYSNGVKRLCYESDSVGKIIEGVKQIPVMCGKTAWENSRRIILRTLKDAEHEEIHKRVDSRMSLNYEDSSILIINDQDAPKVLKKFVMNYIPNDSAKVDSIVKSFRRFHGSYQPNGFYYNSPERYQRDNKSVIEHWALWCFSDKNKFDRLPSDMKLIVDNVAMKLKKYYRCE